jgi:hypothetical protein
MATGQGSGNANVGDVFIGQISVSKVQTCQSGAVTRSCADDAAVCV